jgi:hypothetical protein
LESFQLLGSLESELTDPASPLLPEVASAFAFPPLPLELSTEVDALASPPFPVSPDVTFPVVLESPDFVVELVLLVVFTEPESPEFPESPEVAVLVVLAFPPLPVSPVLPVVPLVADEFVVHEPNTVTHFVELVAVPLVPEDPDDPESPPFATPPDVAEPVLPVLVLPVVADVLFDVELVALPVFPPVVVPFAVDDPLDPPLPLEEFFEAVASPELPPEELLVAGPVFPDATVELPDVLDGLVAAFACDAPNHKNSPIVVAATNNARLSQYI